MKRYSLIVLISVLLGSCASQNQPKMSDHGSFEAVSVAPSFLASSSKDDAVADQKSSSATDLSPQAGSSDGEDKSDQSAAMTFLTVVERPDVKTSTVPLLVDLFPDHGELSISADKMPLRDFLHYSLGELLKVSYILDPAIDDDQSTLAPVTLSLASAMTQRQLFSAVSELLVKRNIQLRYGNDIFYVYVPKNANSSNNIAVAIGRNLADVPNTAQTILQVVPLNYGIKVALQSSIARLTDALVTPDFNQNALYIKGKREAVVRALELVEMLDSPAARGRYIGMINLDFVTPEEFVKEVNVLMLSEGIITSVGADEQRNLVMVPLEKLGAVAIFAAAEMLLERVAYWAKVVDVAGGGTDEQYFLYKPKFARALDLGKSMMGLIGGDLSDGSMSQAVAGGSEATGMAPDQARTVGVSSQRIRMVVDERANALIFYTTGSEYRALKPLLTELDTLPKQVALDILIAEVTLQDEFKYGVEWALSRGEVNLTTDGAFGVASIGGIGLVVNGNEGPLTANLLQTNSLVNVLSNPTLTVRDGVSANINVGSDISVIGATTQDPINGQRQTTTSEYRKTGVSVSVTPTVNSSGIVVLEIDQEISNSVPNSSGASGNPDIFERSIKTEVVARSGQTVMLGGLVSQNYDTGGSSAPGLGKIPLLGNLFKARSNNNSRTELIMLVTPKVIDDLDQWDSVLDDFRQALIYLELDGQ